ncbi:nucleotidyltransferase substrate binding protein [Clostridium sporogenes]|uniref:Nucleotidyltransferase n=2 Tax=Clostridium TaxID=1485 RepID=A0A6M0T0D4_CLOBO|nr:nucleotidyltransferase substrate binding protein [Clostridium sporogenes]NFA60934.1 nucleotidyltransferase [Clostridium botulinum]MDS1005280.1 nucleotidyltransferase substrate binding protein [Clostridium sporogenes]NFI75445.1 nucleotidyltransferase [Clostridium sporogenes]NFL73180.1 nucleotidyltransferase [Clostridium sporogenes]NFM25730.1 nucleotidyltransferase [Clostridium sporogenes]
MLKNRLEERLEDFKKAFKKLKESTDLKVENDIVIDGVIQRFEFTFEQSWKLMKLYLEYEGIEEAKSPRSTIRAAFKYGIIEDGDAWISMMIDRNKTSHVYDENTAIEIYNSIKSNHVNLLEKMLNKMEELL